MTMPRAEESVGPEGDRDVFAIADLAREFGISTRAIRFYEAKGLISPERMGTARIFRRRDRARLMLVLRGKRLGFSLRDIADYLALYEVDRAQRAQVTLLLEMVERRLGILARQSADLDLTITELREIKALADQALAAR